jgi:prepilin-type N-terminal cleavage/methylation domain-containing protein
MIKNIFSKNKEGFTLIELLVVISIIGLLSSIVLASLSTTRVRASDAAIKADLHGIRTSSEIEYANLGYSYNKTGLAITSDDLSTFNTPNVIFNNQKIKDAVLDIMKNNGGKKVTGNASSDGKTYNISVPLKTSDDNMFLSETGVIEQAILAAPTNLRLSQDGPRGLNVKFEDNINTGTVSYEIVYVNTSGNIIARNISGPYTNGPTNTFDITYTNNSFVGGITAKVRAIKGTQYSTYLTTVMSIYFF